MDEWPPACLLGCMCLRVPVWSACVREHAVRAVSRVCACVLICAEPSRVCQLYAFATMGLVRRRRLFEQCSISLSLFITTSHRSRPRQ